MDLRFGGAEMAALASDPDRPAVDRVAPALADAAAEIDAVLARAWDLPLPAGPWPALTRIQCSLARALLYDDATLEAPMRLRDQSMKLLRAMRDGEADLVDGAGTVQARRSPVISTAASDDMTRAQLEML